jgi:hypothetical protein
MNSTIEYRHGLPERPSRVALLPLNEKGYPVPWFVATCERCPLCKEPAEIVPQRSGPSTFRKRCDCAAELERYPDFRVADEEKLIRAIKKRLCWICGEKLGQHCVFVAGPMCGINRTSAEPPSHRECAEYAAKACPFLTMPKVVRRDARLPPGHKAPAGVMLHRNPGVTMLWVCDEWRMEIIRHPQNAGDPGAPQAGILFQMGDPSEVLWFADGRAASREEVLESIKTGMPALKGVAMQQGERAVLALNAALQYFERYLPERSAIILAP